MVELTDVNAQVSLQDVSDRQAGVLVQLFCDGVAVGLRQLRTLGQGGGVV